MALPTSSMAPPHSPKEPRRSNRRSAHSSTSTSKSSGSPSPDATSVPPPAKEPDNHSSARSAASSSSHSSSARPKRAKEEHDDSHVLSAPGHRRTTSISSTNAVVPAPTPKRTKRRAKEPAPQSDDLVDPALADGDENEQNGSGEGQEEEDAGITRCVCEVLGMNPEDDADAPDFMIQCEICKVWQHGPCMGFATEDEIPQGDYYCEQCKPEDHVEVIKKLNRHRRQSSEKSVRAALPSRTSRSHSPTHFLKASKRRNTMNSRDAAYDEARLLQEIMDASVAEVSGLDPGNRDNRTGSMSVTEEAVEELVMEIGPGSRKKRKRADEELVSAKRKRSASIMSDHLLAGTTNEKLAETPVTAQVDLASLLPPPAPPTGGKSRVRRGGGRKNATTDVSVNGEGEEGSAPRKHPNQYTYRGKPGGNAQPRRAPPTPVGQNQSSVISHDHGTRRNANNVANAGAGSGSGSRNAHNAYYNNIQVPMFTSWGLPDYLAHLQSILPNEVPPPLQIRGATSFFREDVSTTAAPANVSEGSDGTGANASTDDTDPQNVAATQMAAAMANATESMTERGVKVKWPAKRMSVADMNKRVRALVEWVGREQAIALDRERRKVALESALLANQQAQMQMPAVAEAAGESAVQSDPTEGLDTQDKNESGIGKSTPIAVDGISLTETLIQEKTTASAAATGRSSATSDPTNESAKDNPVVQAETKPILLFGSFASSRPSTTKMMEELMEELISFQERFGPGAKGQGKERSSRIAALA